MMEIIGFNKALKVCEAEQTMNKLLASAKKRKIRELVEQGIDKEIAKVMVQTGLC